jgi:hypothetical protein
VTSLLERVSVIFEPTPARAINEVPVESGLTSDNVFEGEFLPDALGRATCHGSPILSIAQQVENFCSQHPGCSGRNQEAIPSVANDLGATGHGSGHDWHTGERRLEKHPWHAFPILGRKREYIREREQ